MSSNVVAALIGLVGIVVGAILREILPGSFIVDWLSTKSRRHNLRGEWESSWGPLPKGPVKFHETLNIYRQKGVNIWGTAMRNDEPNKKWEIRGRYDGLFLQMYYFPSDSSKNIDFLDYGCYFFKRKADGSFSGYSTGFGDAEDIADGEISTDYHELKRR